MINTKPKGKAILTQEQFKNLTTPVGNREYHIIVKEGGTTAERPTVPDLHQTYYDTTLNRMVVWNGTAWVDIDSSIATKLNSSAKGETANKTLTFGGTFKVLETLANGTVNERIMTMPATPTDTNNYLTGVSGSANGTATFTRQGLDNLTWNTSHNHNQLYNIVGDTRSTPTFPTDYNNVLKISGYKDSAAVGRTGSLMGVNGYVDQSGGVLELSWNNDRLSFRTAKNSTEWNSWGEVASEQWVASNTRSNTWVPSWSEVTGAPDIKSWAIDGKAQRITGDLNNVTDVGFYDGSGLTNAPTAGWYLYIVNRYGDDAGWVSQEAISFGSGNITNRKYIRTKAGGDWTAWKEVLTFGDGDNRYLPLASLRDFVDGTTINTNIDYSQTSGAPFLLRIYGNTYSRLTPIETVIQGYIYNDTIINYGGYSVGNPITGLVALNVGGKLTFWFPRQGYWEGYFAEVFDVGGAGRKVNLVTSIIDTPKPTGTKEVSFSNIVNTVLDNDYRLTDARPASDVHTWAKAETVPIWNQNTTGNAATATNADKLDGLDLNGTTRNNEVNKVMRTDESGYSNFGWINTTSGNTESAVSDVYVNTGDGHIRKKTLALFKTELGTMPPDSHSHDILKRAGNISYGTSGLQWMDVRGTGGTGANGQQPENPHNDWFHHLIMNHPNNVGYYTDIITAFHEDRIFFKKVSNSVHGDIRELWHNGNLTKLSQLTNDPGYVTSNDFLTGVSGSGNGTVTFTRSGGLSSITWDASHTHSYNLDQISDGTTYKRVTSSEKSTWNNKVKYGTNGGTKTGKALEADYNTSTGILTLNFT